MKKTKETEPDYRHCCARCNKHFDFDDPAFPATFPDPKGQLTEYAGTFVHMALGTTGKTIPAFVTTEDSGARKVGQDIMASHVA